MSSPEQPLAAQTRSTVIPGLLYRDCAAAIEWLCTALGFEKQAVFAGPDGTIRHAQLTFGNGMIHLGSASNESPYGALMVQPDEIGGRATHSVSLIASDADALYSRARAAGAEMVFEIADMHYGGRAFTCRDPEGRLWNIGSWDPWTTKQN